MWSEQGHEKVCCKRGKFRVGDPAVTRAPFGNVSSGVSVRIKAPAAPDDPNQWSPSLQWVVKSMEGDKIGTIPATCLKQLQLAMWHI